MNIIKHPVWILFWGNPCISVMLGNANLWYTVYAGSTVCTHSHIILVSRPQYTIMMD